MQQIKTENSSFYSILMIIPLVLSLSSCSGGSGGTTQNPPSGNPSVAAKTKSLPVGSAQCPNGGITVETGIDQNGNGVLDTYEVNNTQYVCNGQNGGISSLVKTTQEAAGANCTYGGIRIDSGLDLNSSGVLDTAEITSTSYVCNGGSGSTISDPTSYCSTHYNVDTLISFSCDGNAVRSYSDYYQVGSCGIGTPYKRCINESCSKSLYEGSTYAGSYSHSKQTGAGCSLYEYESLYCSDGYVASNGTCVSGLTLLTTQQACTAAGKYWWNNACHHDCPSDQVKTTRGCEVPNTACTPYQSIPDNLCVNLSFTTVTGSICGLYSSPVQILAGNHLVTCDSAFQDKVVIEPGASLFVDNYWGITFKNIYSKGTSTNHIVFNKSAGNPAGGWKSLAIQNGESNFNYANGYLSGNYLSYVDIGGFLESSLAEVIIEKTYVENLNLNGAYDVDFDDVYVTNSNFNIKGLSLNVLNYSDYTHLNLFTRNTVSTTGSVYLYNTFTAWSTFNNAVSAYYNSALMYSNVNGNVSCYDSSDPKLKSHVYGNKISGTIYSACAQSDNTTVGVSNQIGVFVLNDLASTIYVNQGKDFNVYVLDKTNWLTSAPIVWGATYDIDGIVYNYSTTWSGYNPTVLFNTKEAYKLNVNTINGVSNHIGKKSVTVNVW